MKFSPDTDGLDGSGRGNPSFSIDDYIKYPRYCAAAPESKPVTLCPSDVSSLNFLLLLVKLKYLFSAIRH